jgi:hypothetical protein
MLARCFAVIEGIPIDDPDGPGSGEGDHAAVLQVGQ